MIRVTDISTINNGMSPHKYLREIFNETVHGVPRTALHKSLPAPAGLEALTTDSRLRVMAAMLSDADLSPSAATDYDFGRKMTKVFSVEMPAVIKDSDQTLAGFIAFVTEKQFTSAAGNYLSRGALEAIFTEASIRAEREKQLANNNVPPAAPKGPQPNP
jgi:hypothetical protein